MRIKRIRLFFVFLLFSFLLLAVFQNNFLKKIPATAHRAFTSIFPSSFQKKNNFVQKQTGGPAQQEKIDPDYVPDQLLIKFKPGVAPNEIAELVESLGAEIVSEFKMPSGLYLLRLPKGITVSRAIQFFERDPRTSGVEPNYIYQLASIPDDTYFDRQWALKNTGQDGGVYGIDINAEAAWDTFTGSDEVVIGIIDTGVDYTHVDLKDNIWINPAEVPGNGVDDDNNGWVDDIHGIDTFSNDSDPIDEHGHGTHVAGIIAASGNNGEGVVGVMWRASLAVCRFMGPIEGGASGTTAGAIGCLNYFADLKRRGVNLLATNNSWGNFDFSIFLSEAIYEHKQEEILLVAAAGNFGCEFSHYPADYEWDNIISVGATENYYGGDFLCRGDVHAPGYRIFSTLPGHQYGYQTGTSMAAPLVSGMLGLYQSHQPSLDSMQVKQILLETAESTRASTYPMARLEMPSDDQDNDGLPDEWERLYGFDNRNPKDAAQDADGDGLINSEEYFAGTNPREQDSDGDGLLDGAEIQLHGTNPLSSDSDGDSLADDLEINAYQTDPLSVDTDNDGLADNLEVQIYGTDPLSADSDSDTMPDGWEVTYGLDPLNSADANVDGDGDGILNVDEVLYGSAPDSRDTDGDGLADGDEVGLLGTDPASTDSDGDRMPDNWEITNGLNPSAAEDALTDQDADGHDALREFLSGTDPLSSASVPKVIEWTMSGGNAAHNRFIPFRTELSAPLERWSTHSFSLDRINTTEVVTAKGAVITRSADYGLLAFSAFDGQPLWELQLGQEIYPEWSPSQTSTPLLQGDLTFVSQSVNDTAYANAEEKNADLLHAVDIETGTLVYSQFLTQHTPGPVRGGAYGQILQYGHPLPDITGFNQDVVIKDGDTVKRVDAQTGLEVWQSHVGGEKDFWTPLIWEDVVLGFSSGKLIGLNVKNGARQIELGELTCRYRGSTRIAEYRSRAVIFSGGCLSVIDLSLEAVIWAFEYSGVESMAVDDRHVYLLTEDRLEIRHLGDGAIYRVVNDLPLGNSRDLLVSLDHVFISAQSGTYAVDIPTGEIVWRYNRGGKIALSDDGALLINGERGFLYSVNVEADLDNDGLPGWWERFYGLNPLDTENIYADTDGDGFTDLEEFSIGTNPLVVDTDGDGIEDRVEVVTYQTNPTQIDTDADGLSDGQEQVTYGTDPLVSDSDGDAVRDGDEVLVFFTDPLDAASRPPLVSSYQESFEEGAPRNWIAENPETTDWNRDSEIASDGDYSLKSGRLDTGEVSEISWRQVFVPGTLSFDVKVNGEVCCDILRVYLDDKIVVSITSGDWQTQSIDVPPGMHTIKWSYLRASGEGYADSAARIDRVRYEPHAPMAVSPENILLFHDHNLYEFDITGNRIGIPINFPELENVDDIVALTDHRLLLSNGKTFHFYDLTTGHQWSTENPAGDMAQCGNGGGQARFASIKDSIFYPATQCAFGLGIAELDDTGQYLGSFLTDNRYLDLASGPDNTLYALRGEASSSKVIDSRIDVIDIEHRTILRSISTEVSVERILVDQQGELVAKFGKDIYRLDREGRVKAKAGDPPGYIDDLGWSVSGSIFLGGVNGGIGVLDPALGLKLFSMEHTGLPTSAVGGVKLAAIRTDGSDLDADGIPDWWERFYGLDPSSSSDANGDLDVDGLSNLEEYRAGASPLESDSDFDGITDSVEVLNHLTSPGSADTDKDGISDKDEIHTYRTNPLLKDSDGDGVGDNEEISQYGSNPLIADSDGDGLPDEWEIRYSLNPVNPDDAAADGDDDELSNLQEYGAGTDPGITDSDFDGVSDGREVLVYGTSPLHRDSDGDYLSDRWEIEFALDPHDPSDAQADADLDGFSNAKEYFSQSAPDDPQSFPMVLPWVTEGGDSRHRSHVPVSLNPVNFVERWSLRSASSDPIEVANPAMTSGGKVFISERNTYWDEIDLAVFALDAFDGGLTWKQEVGLLRPVQRIALGKGTVNFFGERQDYIGRFFSIDQNSGRIEEVKTETIQRVNNTTPLVPYLDHFYSSGVGYKQILSIDAGTGEQVWSLEMDTVSGNPPLTPAVDERYLYSFYKEDIWGTSDDLYGLVLIDRATGEVARTIPDPELQERQAWITPVIGSQENIIVTYSGDRRISSISTVSATVEWSVNGEFEYKPAYANGVVYAIESSGLVAINEYDGAVLWRWQSDDAPLVESPLLTDSHAFVSSHTEVFAIDLTTGFPVWRFARGGHLSMGEDGALYIAGFDGGISAISVMVPDADGDGMPDAWERLNGLDTGVADQALDPDKDGVSNLQEFAARTHPHFADTDGDGLTDGAELFEHGTDPGLADTDADGLADGDELLLYATDPLIDDTDEDGLPDGDEVTTFETSPASQDTDRDGMPDGYEVEFSFDPRTASDGTEDPDGDGLANAREYSQGTDPHVSDSDGDGLSDGLEVDTYFTHPLLVDSDRDRIPDGKELEIGLDPLNDKDGTADRDGDGYLNAEEYFAGSNVSDSESVPVIPSWSIERGNTIFDSYVPLSLNPVNFHLRWLRDMDGAKATAFSNIVTSDGRAAIVGFRWDSEMWRLGYQGYSESKALSVLDVRTGEILWERKLHSYEGVSGPAIEDGVIYLTTERLDGILGVNLYTGENSLVKHFSTESHFWYTRPPVPYLDTLYLEQRNKGLIGLGVEIGDETLRHTTREMRQQLTAVDERNVYYFAGGASEPLRLDVLDRETGGLRYSITSELEQFYVTPNFTPLVSRSGMAFAAQGSLVVAFDLVKQSVAWYKQFPPSDNWFFGRRYADNIAHANGVLYVINDGDLVALKERSGEELWRWDPGDVDLTSNFVVTNEHIFAATDYQTFAVSLEKGSSVWNYPAGGALSLDNNGLLYIVAGDGTVHAIEVEGDLDADGMPDWWERRYGLNPRFAGDASRDSDGDDLLALDEYLYQTSPVHADSDSDGLTDGQEVNAAGSNPTQADTDGDGLPDGDEVLQYGSSPSEADSDQDGLDDYQEVSLYQTDPGSSDSDGDGLPDGIEVAASLNPLDADDAEGDRDLDGLSNLEEFHNGSDLALFDTDHDGIADGQEVNEFSTSPLLRDSDGDWLPDLWELNQGLDPLLDNGFKQDVDADGFPDVIEYFSGTSAGHERSVPAIAPWSGRGGGGRNSSFVPIVIDPQAIEAYASVHLLDNFYYMASRPVSGIGRAFVTHRGPNRLFYITAIDTISGKKLWQSELGTDGTVSPPALAEDAVWLFAGRSYRGEKIIDSDYTVSGSLLGLDLATGALKHVVPVSRVETSYSAPTIVGEMLYGYSNTPSPTDSEFNQGKIFAANIRTGEIIWERLRLARGGWSPAVDGDFIYEFSPIDAQQLSITDRNTGKKHLVVADSGMSQGAVNESNSPVVTLSGAVVIQGGRLVAFDQSCVCVAWELSGNFRGVPAYAPGRIYAIDETSVVVVDERKGGEVDRFKLRGESVDGESLLTLTHLFVSTSTGVEAINLESGISEWNYPTPGRLALGNDRKLLLATVTGELVAFNLTADSDNDGLPDNWESSHGLNVSDPGDASQDQDADSVSNLHEFYLGSSPLLEDTDGDGIEDNREIDLGSRLNSADSDSDGLDDFRELNETFTNLLHPDSDRDGITDRDEIALYHSDPLSADSDADVYDDGWEISELSDVNNSDSHPSAMGYLTISFEDGRLPPQWSQVADAENGWVVVRRHAREGEYALFAMSPESDVAGDEGQVSSVLWKGEFPTGDLQFDFFDPKFISRSTFNVYVDEQLMFSSTGISERWLTKYVRLLEGLHEIRWEFSSNGTGGEHAGLWNILFMDTVILDNLRIVPIGTDSDHDGMPDSWEIDYGLGHDYAGDALQDADADGLINLEEMRWQTSPLDPDSDGDGMPDFWEVYHQLKPNFNDASEDPDGDGFTNLHEYQIGTDPNVYDGAGNDTGGSGEEGDAGAGGDSGGSTDGITTGNSSGVGGNSGGGSGGGSSIDLHFLLLLLTFLAGRWWSNSKGYRRPSGF